MATDRTIVEGLFAMDNNAFYRFDKEKRDLFEAYFHKKFPKSPVSIPDLYQESILELWHQIMEGELTESNLYIDITSYLISIARNKFFEETRSQDKFSKLKKGVRVYKKRNMNPDAPDEEDEGKEFVLQSKKQQIELNTSINESAYQLDPRHKSTINPDEEPEDVARKRRIERQQYVESQIDAIPEPCRSIIRDTWWNNGFSDDELIRDSDGQFPTLGALRAKRHRCHKVLREKLEPWYRGQLNS